MAFDWKEYLNLASFLSGKDVKYTQEASWRSAVSRAYYAAFGHARKYAITRQGFPASGKPEDHGDLVRHFSNKGMAEIGNTLNNLRNWRNQCDYDEKLSININTAVTFAIFQSKKILNDLA